MKTITTATVNKGGIKITKTAILLTCTCHPCGTKCTARLFMPYIGGGHGMTILPREEDEVLLLFPDSNINMGIAMWGLYAGPDTVPEGTAENLILVEGRQGDDIVLHVRGNVSVHIDGFNDTLIDGPNTLTVKGNNTTTLEQNDVLTIDGHRETVIGGTDHTTVYGIYTIIAQGIVFNSLSTVSSEITGSYTLTAEGLSFTSTAAASITAATTITLNAGGGTLTLTPAAAAFNVPVSAPNIP